MRVLLDTQCWLWMQVSPDRFSGSALSTIEHPETELLLSAASSWEIAIKTALGKLTLPTSPTEYVPDRMRSSGVVGLPIEHSHALQVFCLPLHHRDPFDRLLIAQTQVEKLSLLTADKQLAQYDVQIEWAE